MAQLKRESNPPPGLIASPEPQYWNEAVQDYETLKGQHGAPYASLIDADGNTINPATAEGLGAIKTILQSADYATDTKLEAISLLLGSLDDKDYATQTTLAQVKAELESIKANQLSGEQKVTLNGHMMELRGSLANRPAANAPSITPYVTLYWAMDDGWTYGSDGTNWHKVVEVNAPWIS